MALTWWWMGALLVAATIAVVAVRWFRRSRAEKVEEGLLASHTTRLKEAPRYRALAKEYALWVGVQAACLLLSIGGAVLLAGRLSITRVERPEEKNRDIVLCLDTSGSMMQADERVLRAYADLAGRMKGERLSLVLWDSSPVTAFPLTNDYDFIKTQLSEYADSMGDFSTRLDKLAGTMEGDGSSLIGDGIAACVMRFDRLESDRPRTLVLATDNEVSGSQIYTFDEGIALASEKKIMVYGVYPHSFSYASENSDEMKAGCQRTGGDMITLDDASKDTKVIADAIRKKEAATYEGQPVRWTQDAPFIGSLLLGVGVVGLAATAWKVRR